MKWKPLALAGAVSLPIVPGALALGQTGPVTPLEPWTPVVNRNDLLPDSSQPFDRFSAPSVNRGGAVVFRGTAGDVPYPLSGVYLRRMGSTGQPLEPMFVRGGDVASPNNVESPAFSGQFAGYRDFPWFPRLDADAVMATARGTSGAVWRFFLPNGEELLEGTSGVFATANGDRYTAASMLGDVRDPDTLAPYFPEFAVPNEGDGTAFEGFPGIPSMGGSRWVALKGAWRAWTHPGLNHEDYTEGLYVRDLQSPFEPLLEIVTTETDIPMPLVVKSQPRFEVIGSPSSYDGQVAFLGVDDDHDPHHGGIYLYTIPQGKGSFGASPLGAPSLTAIVEIGDRVPGFDVATGVSGPTFEQLGEAISFNDRWIAFWGSWGHKTETIHVDCPEEWEVDDPELAKYCQHAHAVSGFHAEIPRNQGIFVYDTQTDTIVPVAMTHENQGSDAEIENFVFWTFEGTVPQDWDSHGGHGGGGGGNSFTDENSFGMGGGGGGGGGGGHGEDDGVPVDETEIARWRPNIYLAIENALGYGGTDQEFRVAFMGQAHDGHDAIFMASGPSGGTPTRIISTHDLGSVLDADCPQGARITQLRMEREALREGWFVISATMWNHDTHQSWAGVYASGSTLAGADFNRDGFSDIFWHSEEFDRSSFWAMHGLEWNQGGYTSLEPEADWTGQFTADLNGDRKPDIIWRDQNTGVFAAWIMDGGDVLDAGAISGTVEPWWRIIAVGDLNHDDRDDIVLINDDTGEVRGWLMDGLVKTDGGAIGNAAGLTFLGMGDLDADRHHDLLWQRPDGVVEGWRMFNLAIVETGEVGNAHPVDPNWHVVGMADLDGDLRDDVIWHDPENGWVAAWKMNGLTRVQGDYLALDLGGGQRLIAARDLDADGHADLVWRDDDSGDVYGWLMDGFSIAQSAFIRSVETYWRPIP